MATALTPLFVALPVSPAFAEGGDGNGGVFTYGRGGSDNPSGTGGSGADSTNFVYGGGGGGAGVTGGKGGDSVNAPPGAVIATGGAGGVNPGADGEDGQDNADAVNGGGHGGGGGGGGGAHGYVGSSSFFVGGASGGDGGRGGDGTTDIVASGMGGGGGAGGYGAVITQIDSLNEVSGNATGGTGGAGGTTFRDEPSYFGGNGGSGGTGLFVQASGTLEILTGVSITGGAGGDAGITTSAVNPGAKGGVGGAGLAGNGFMLDIASGAAITGGMGGAGDAGHPGGFGLGGAGIEGANLSIVTAGTITGGTAGNGITISDAIAFTGGTNRLELRDGYSVTGTVRAFSTSDILALGGNADDGFNMSGLGTQYVGFGSLEKTGTGTWNLTGTDTEALAWTIKEGALTVGAAQSLQGDIAFAPASADPVRVTFNQVGSTLGVYGGNISGAGDVEFVGDSTALLRLTGNNTYTGATTIKSLVVETVSANALSAASTYTLVSSAILNLLTNDGEIGGLAGSGSVLIGRQILTVGGNDETTTFNGQITGSSGPGGIGTLFKTGTGTLTLGNSQSFANTVVDEGTLALSNTAVLQVSGSTTINAAGTFDLGGTLQTQSGGVFLDGGTLKNGALNSIISSTGGRIENISGTGSFELFNGTAEIDGTNLYSGPTRVSGGALEVLAGASIASDAGVFNGGLFRVNGTAAAVEVLNGTLAGTGTVGTTQIGSGGIHAPGNSIGTQTVLGNYTNHGALEIEATPSAADQIIVLGTVDITGAALDLVLTPLAVSGWNPVNGPFTIIDNDDTDAVTGTFAPITKNLIFLNQTLDYAGGDGNDVTLSLFRNDIDFAAAGETSNQKAAANGVESLSPGTLWGAIVVLSDADVARASFDQLSGEVHASTASALLEESRRVRDAVNDRLRAAFGEVGATALLVMAYAHGGPVLAPATTERFAVWGQGFGSWTSFDGDGNAAGLDANTGGFLLGGDGQAGDWRLGVLAGYSRTAIDLDDRNSSAESDNIHLGMYGGRTFGALAVRTGLAYSRHAIDTERFVVMPGIFDELDADYDAATAQAFGELGYRVDTSGVSFEPFANLAYVHFDSDGFTENGGVAALSGGDATTETAFTTLGLRAATDFAFGNLTATAHGTLGWRHAFGDITPLTEFAFAGGSAFTIAGVPITEDAAVVAAGLDFAVSDTVTFGISYDGQFGDGVSGQSVQTTFTARF